MNAEAQQIFCEPLGGRQGDDRQKQLSLSFLLNGCGIFEGFNVQIDVWVAILAKFENDANKFEIAN